MKLTKTRRPTSIAFNMTPMIDIVFLLIIFFMTVSQITKTAEIPLELPVVTRGTREFESGSFTININEEGKIFVADVAKSLDDSVSTIGKFLEQNNIAPNQAQVLIRCDRNATSRTTNRLFEKLANLGITHVRVAVTGKDSPSTSGAPK